MNADDIPAAKHLPQVSAGAYGQKYLSLVRLITHWYQANAIISEGDSGTSVLEIGAGAGHTTWLLRNFGYVVTTLDFDPNLRPEIVGDVTNLPCGDTSFDIILCAEVLEHLPFAEFEGSLRELRRVARKAVILTLPAPLAGLSLMLNISGLASRGIHFGLPYWVTHRFDGEHFWEVGKRNHSLRKVKRIIKESGFSIVSAFRPVPSLYSYFFVLHPNEK